MSTQFPMPILDTGDAFRFLLAGRIDAMGAPQRLQKGDLPDEMPADWYNTEQMAVRFGGLFSVEGDDRQGEDLVQDGMDWSYFGKHGWFNYEHRQNMEDIVGVPIDGTIRPCTDDRGKPATYGEGWLLLGTKYGPDVYALAKNLELTRRAGVDTGRQVGFSIEGKALERDKENPKKVLKSRVYKVSFVTHAIQTSSRLQLIKGEGAEGLGYQTPASTSGAGNLSALYPQSLDGVVHGALHGKQKPVSKIGMRRIMQSISARNPRLSESALFKATLKMSQYLTLKKGVIVEDDL